MFCLDVRHIGGALLLRLRENIARHPLQQAKEGLIFTVFRQGNLSVFDIFGKRHAEPRPEEVAERPLVFRLQGIENVVKGLEARQRNASARGQKVCRRQWLFSRRFQKARCDLAVQRL